ncbi:MAG TPA: hypothetical protein VIH91_01800 [Terriglobales bacterium]
MRYATKPTADAIKGAHGAVAVARDLLIAVQTDLTVPPETSETLLQ